MPLSPKASSNDDGQRKLNRVVRSKSMMAWSEIFRDAVCAKLEIHDSDDKAKPFYRDFTEEELAKIKYVLARLLDWKRWNSPDNDEIDRVMAGNKSVIKDWFRDHGLTAGYLMGAPE